MGNTGVNSLGIPIATTGGPEETLLRLEDQTGLSAIRTEARQLAGMALEGVSIKDRIEQPEQGGTVAGGFIDQRLGRLNPRRIWSLGKGPKPYIMPDDKK